MTDNKPRYDIYTGSSSEAQNFHVFDACCSTEASPGFYTSADTIELATTHFLSALFETGFSFAYIEDTATKKIIRTSIGSNEELKKEYRKNKGIEVLPTLELEKSRNWIAESKQKFGKNIDKKYYGVSYESNQLILGNIFIVGAFPYRCDILKLRELGINTYCCLNDEYGKYVKGTMYNEYKRDLLPNELFIHEPIPDMETIEESKIDGLSDKLAALILDGKKIYLHCAGGHGRAGMIACATLHKLYPELSENDIMNYVQFAHDQRTCKFDNVKYTKCITNPSFADCFKVGQVPSPQTSKQRDLVSLIIQRNQKRIRAKKDYDDDVYLQQQIQFDEWFERMNQHDIEEQESLERSNACEAYYDKQFEDYLRLNPVESESTEEKTEANTDEESSVITFSISRKPEGK